MIHLNHTLTLLLITLWIWAPLTQLKAAPWWALSGNSTAPNVVVDAYVPYVATFDGTNDLLRLSSSSPPGLTADGSRVECSFWIKLNGGDDVNQQILRITNNVDDTPRLKVERTGTGSPLGVNKIALYGAGSTGFGAVFIGSTQTVTVSSGWTHVYIFADLTNAANRGIYINGVQDTLLVTTFVANAAIDLQGNNYIYKVGGAGATVETPALNGSLAEFYFNDSVNCTISDFYSNGNAVDLGLLGQLPSGSSPVFYLSKAGNNDSWATNSGTGGNFTVIGALTTETF